MWTELNITQLLNAWRGGELPHAAPGGYLIRVHAPKNGRVRIDALVDRESEFGGLLQALQIGA